MVNMTDEVATNVPFVLSNNSESNSIKVRHSTIPHGLLNQSNNTTNFQSSIPVTEARLNSTSTAPLLRIISSRLTSEGTTTKSLANDIKFTDLRHIDTTNAATQQESISSNSFTETNQKTTKTSFSSILKTMLLASSKTYSETTISSKSISTDDPQRKTTKSNSYNLDTNKYSKNLSTTDQFRTPTEPKTQPTTTSTKRPIIRKKTFPSTSQTMGTSNSTNIPVKISKVSVKSTLKKKFDTSLSTKRVPVSWKSEMTSTFYPTESQSSNTTLYLGPTKEPVQTMGAGALVIVVLLPFLALFLIAVVTALRRKMKKSGRRPNRYQNRNTDVKLERNQSQMVPLTRSDETE